MTRKTLSLGLRKQKPRSINADSIDTTETDPIKRFINGTAVHPSEQIRLESGSHHHTCRALDLIAPIGKGQRGLIVAPPGSGKTTFLKHICQSIESAYPEIKLYILLIDERPEEVTDFKRSVLATVHASSSDESYANHVRIANEVLELARRDAGAGQDVMVVIDSLTRLARIHNAEQKRGGHTMSGGIGTNALEIPRKMFGAARNIENGGSLTILATILADTGSRMDQVIFEEFKGTGNMEVVLSREIANQRIFPAIDIAKSSTRRDELLLSSKNIASSRTLRRALVNQSPLDGAITLQALLEKYSTNSELLESFILKS